MNFKKIRKNMAKSIWDYGNADKLENRTQRYRDHREQI